MPAVHKFADGVGSFDPVIRQQLDDNFGASPVTPPLDGSVNISTFINNSIAAGIPVYLIPGATYTLTAPIFLTGPFSAEQGVYTGGSVYSSGQGATLRVAAGYSANQMVYIGNPNYNTTPVYSVGSFFSNINVDDRNMVDNVNYSGVYVNGAYQTTLMHCRFGIIQFPGSHWNLNLGRGVAEIDIIRCKGQQLQVASDTLDRVTTARFDSTSWTFININNALDIAFASPTIQGTTGAGYQTNRVQISNSYDISFEVGDLEGNGNLYTLTNVSGFITRGNNLGSTSNPQVWPGTTYYTDNGGNSRIALMDNFAYQDEGAFTPALVGAGSPTYTLQTGKYQTIGKRVHVTGWLTWTGATPGGSLVINGMPFQVENITGHDCPVAAAFSGVILGAGNVLQAAFPKGGTQLNLNTLSQSAGTTSIATIPAAGSIQFNGSYIRASL
jgi:hypothetical protein